jgi:hypothetical protein
MSAGPYVVTSLLPNLSLSKRFIVRLLLSDSRSRFHGYTGLDVSLRRPKVQRKCFPKVQRKFFPHGCCEYEAVLQADASPPCNFFVTCEALAKPQTGFCPVVADPAVGLLRHVIPVQVPPMLSSVYGKRQRKWD